MSDLPIFQQRDAVLAALTQHNSLILEAPTGSGKSTQVPQFLLDGGLLGPEEEICVLQPRRVAAKSLARRVAQERLSSPGEEVGYQVRFEKALSARTRIRFITEGILLRELLSRPLLEHIGCIVFDEFHERSLNTDLSLALALRLQEIRPELKLILMSATLPGDRLQQFLPQAAHLRSEGRSFPVDIQYLERETEDPCRSAARLAERLCASSEGDLLIFMPGRGEIERCLNELKRSSIGKQSLCLPLHGECSPEEQDRALAPAVQRKIIVATNIAETSLTIPGVTLVIDSGLARVARYDASRGINRLDLEPISKASAQQRSGRAGRLAPGRCLRLWTQREQAARAEDDTPEILRVDLSEAALGLAGLGISSFSELQLPDVPSPGMEEQAWSLLQRLGALNAGRDILPRGQHLLSIPAHPRHATLLIEAAAAGLAEEGAQLVALLQGRPFFRYSRGGQWARKRMEQFGGDGSSDLLMQLQAWEELKRGRYRSDFAEDFGLHIGAARTAEAVARQLYRHVDEGPRSPHPVEALRRALLIAFADRIARRRPNSLRCDLVDGRVAELSSDSICKDAEFFVAAELRELPRLKVPQIQAATRIEESWLREIWPGQFMDTRVSRYDEHAKRLVSEERKQFGELVLSSKLSHEVSDDDAARLFRKAIQDALVPFQGWSGEVESWITRLNCLAEWQPDWQLPQISEEDREELLGMLLSGCRTRKDVKSLDLLAGVKEWLDPVQRQLLDQHCPLQLQLPNGRRARIRYEQGKPPVLSSKLQDFFGMKEAPSVAAGAVRCQVELLAPNRRPAALTDDLARFWSEGYLLVRKDLKGRYPKHDWPEVAP